jgi:hypothetical protein
MPRNTARKSSPSPKGGRERICTLYKTKVWDIVLNQQQGRAFRGFAADIKGFSAGGHAYYERKRW